MRNAVPAHPPNQLADLFADTRGMRRPPLPDSAIHEWAWFLDVDGTLLEIEARPDLVSADEPLLGLLEGLRRAYGGAIALISGRSLQQLDEIFGGHRLAAAGSHGVEQRLPDGRLVNEASGVPGVSVERVLDFAKRHPGLLVEQKPYSIGVHYRARPELEATVIKAMERIQAELDNEAKLMRGKMVVELLPAAANKGSAIRSFMSTAPFAGRLPLFIGDDVTDEHAFATVNEFGGMSIKIGSAEGSLAKWQLRSVADLRTWLRSALDARRQELGAS